MPVKPRSNADAQQRWYPTGDQVKDADSIQRTLKQVLDQHYALQDQYDTLKATTKGAQAGTQASASTSPRTQITKGSSAMSGGPTNTTICGLPVEPIDVQTLADGTKLTFVKSQGIFKFL